MNCLDYETTKTKLHNLMVNRKRARIDAEEMFWSPQEKLIKK